MAKGLIILLLFLSFLGGILLKFNLSSFGITLLHLLLGLGLRLVCTVTLGLLLEVFPLG